MGVYKYCMEGRYLEKLKKFIHKWSWTVLLTFCIIGLFYPFIGVAALICMLAPVKFLKKQWFKLLFLVLLMGGFAAQIFFVWGSIVAVGAVFVRMIIITTLLAIVLGIIFNQRTWCTICPMGTMAHYVAKIKPINRRIKHVTFEKQKCVDCKICSKNCPIGIDVLKHKEKGKVTHADCLKCQVCVEKCPKNSLYIA